MTNDTRTFPGEDRPRTSSCALARKLGMSHKEMLAWIEKHKADLEKYGPVIQTPITERRKTDEPYAISEDDR